MAQQPPAQDKYARLASLYQKALSEADASDDPQAYKERARAAYDRAVAKVAQEAAPAPRVSQDIEPIRQPLGPVGAIGTMLATSVPGAPAVASAYRAARSKTPSEDYSAAYQREMRTLGEQEAQAKEELYPGVGTALQLAPMMGLASRLPLVGAKVANDASALAKTIAAGKRVVGAGAVAGVESAGRQGMAEKEMSPAQSAVIGAGLTAGMELAFPLAGTLVRGASRLPVVREGVDIVRSLAKPAAEVVTQARRGMADYFEPRLANVPVLRNLAGAIEPTDAIRVERTVRQAIPTQGQTVAQMRQQATKAAESATGLESALKTAEEAVTESAKRTTARGKALTQRAEREAARTVQAIEEKARTQFVNLAQTQGEGAALRESTLSQMEEIGKEVYGAVRRVQPLPEPPRRIYQQIDKSGPLSSAFDFAQATKQQRRLGERVEQAIEEGVPVTERVKTPRIQNYVLGQTRNQATGEIVDIKRPVLDLETFDYMKRWVNDRVEAGLAGDVSGISRSQAAGLKKQIERMENDFLAAHSPADRAVLEKARSAMRQQFQRLELIQDGLNLTRFTLNAPAQMRAAAERDLSELVTQVSKLPEAERKFFEVPARQAIANLIQSSDQSLESIARVLVGNTQARKRAALALGEEAVTELQKFLPEQVKGAAELAAGPIRRVGERLVERGAAGGGARTQRLDTEAKSLAQQLQGQRERVKQLSGVAEAAQEGISALTDYTAGRGFAATLPGRGLGGYGERAVGGAMAGAIQDQIRGLTPREAIAKLEAYRQNTAARAMFGDALDQALAQLRPRPSAIPSVRAALTGQAAGRF